MPRKLTEIVSDQDAITVHGGANFGGATPRQIINDGVLKYSMGYTTGHTATQILQDHGLIRRTSHASSLTKKGKEYLRAMYSGRLSEILAYSVGYGDVE